MKNGNSIHKIKPPLDAFEARSDNIKVIVMPRNGRVKGGHMRLHSPQTAIRGALPLLKTGQRPLNGFEDFQHQCVFCMAHDSTIHRFYGNYNTPLTRGQLSD